METPDVRTKGLQAVWLALSWCVLAALSAGRAWAGEAEGPKDQPKKAPAKADKEAKAAEGRAAPAMPSPREEIVAKVDETTLTREDLQGARRLFAIISPGAEFSQKQLLAQLIDRVLWSQYFSKNGWRPSPQDLQAALAQFDAQLRRQGTTYRDFLAARDLRPEQHQALMSFDLAAEAQARALAARLDPAEIKAEFNDHRDWYDGSRVRLSQIFVNASGIAHDPKELAKAKERIDDYCAQVVAGKDFDRLANDYSDAGLGGDRGWFTRKGANIEEPLIEAVWGLKVNDVTKPLLGSQGWHILKVTEREPAAFTFDGCKQRIAEELTRKAMESLLKHLRDAAKIETYF